MLSHPSGQVGGFQRGCFVSVPTLGERGCRMGNTPSHSSKQCSASNRWRLWKRLSGYFTAQAHYVLIRHLGSTYLRREGQDVGLIRQASFLRVGTGWANVGNSQCSEISLPPTRRSAAFLSCLHLPTFDYSIAVFAPRQGTREGPLLAYSQRTLDVQARQGKATYTKPNDLEPY